MGSIISSDAMEKLARPHVARAFFADLDLPSGMAYLHSGVGPVAIGSRTYKGVSDPIGGRLVSIGQIDEPQFGQAAAVNLTLSACDRDFLESVRATAREIEGRAATIYFAAFDGETEELITDLIPLFPFGRMTAPKIKFQGIGIRLVTLTIESIWQAKNFPPGGRWSASGQQKRYPGDKGMDYVGVKVTEFWQ